MSNSSFRRGELLKSLYDLTEQICQKRFISTRPAASGEQMDEFLVIRLPYALRREGDSGVFTNGQIIGFVRDIDMKYENTVRLDEISDEIVELFPIVTDFYCASRPSILPFGTDGVGFHAVIINFEIQIFAN